MNDENKIRVIIAFLVVMVFIICFPIALDTWWKYNQKELELMEKELEIRKLELLQKQDTIQHGKTETRLGQD